MTINNVLHNITGAIIKIIIPNYLPNLNLYFGKSKIDEYNLLSIIDKTSSASKI